jgi:hypothetical protein
LSEYLPVELRRQVRERFGDCCAYCRSAEELTVVIFEIEHITPRSLGGTSILENLCLACPMCNRFKSDRVTARDPLDGSEVTLFHPQRDSWEEHFDWNEDFSEITASTSSGRATVELLRMNRPQLVRVRRMWVAMGEHPPNFEL